jgi:hypothetical protein
MIIGETTNENMLKMFRNNSYNKGFRLSLLKVIDDAN